MELEINRRSGSLQQQWQPSSMQSRNCRMQHNYQYIMLELASYIQLVHFQIIIGKLASYVCMHDSQLYKDFIQKQQPAYVSQLATISWLTITAKQFRYICIHSYILVFPFPCISLLYHMPDLNSSNDEPPLSQQSPNLGWHC